jgi:hypothetical protein
MLPTNMLGSFLTCWGISMPGFAVLPEYELVIDSARLEVREWRSFLIVRQARKHASQALLSVPLGL